MKTLEFFAHGTPKAQPRVRAFKRGKGLNSKVRVSTETLLNSYRETGSVWKTAERHGMCGQSVHQRLALRGWITPTRDITDEERAQIRDLYESGFHKGQGILDALAKKLGRTKQLVCRTAGEMGLTTQSRQWCEEELKRMAKTTSDRWKQRPHPKGMLGKKHTDEVKRIISEAGTGRKVSPETVMKILKTRAERGTLARNAPHGKWKAAWREIGGQRIYARSRWEANYGRYLEFLRAAGQIAKWEHEPETFWFESIKRGCRSYLPDFRVTNNDGSIEYHEVKGWMDDRSKTKLSRMKKYHPHIKLRVLDGAWFKSNRRKLSGIVEGWE